MSCKSLFLFRFRLKVVPLEPGPFLTLYLGDIGGCPFYIGRAQYETWKHTQLIIDVIEGTGGTFSLERSAPQT